MSHLTVSKKSEGKDLIPIDFVQGLLLPTILDELASKKANNIVSINLGEIGNSEYSYMLVCEGTSKLHARALAEGVEEAVKKASGLNVFGKHGYSECSWIALDFGDILVHVFLPESRIYYNLEALFPTNIQRKLIF